MAGRFVLVLFLANTCSKSVSLDTNEPKANAAVEQAPAPAPAPAPPPKEEPPPPAEEQPQPPPVEEPAADQTKYPKVTGVHACDEYLWKYRKCVDTKSPKKNRKSLRKALDATTKAWKQVVDGGNGEALGETCTVALDAVKKSAAQWGCEF